MSAVGLWTVGLALAYTALLIVARPLAARRSTGGGGFFEGGRAFSPWTVAFCITALFSGSSFIAILELSYRTGISAVWYGVAETVQVLLIAVLLVKPLRRKLVVTVTGIIGDRFGRGAKAIGSLITGLTFPMYSVATTIAFASALHVVTGLALELSVAATAVVLLAFLWAGGMRSVGFSQTMNVVMIALMFVAGLAAVFAVPDVGGRLRAFHGLRPEMFDLSYAGTSLIVAWFATFIVNVPLAQAAFQMSLSARTPEDGQKGLFLAAVLGAPLIFTGVLLGVVASAVLPDAGRAFVAIPEVVTQVLPPWAAGVFFVGLWACALGWAGPCQFSGATSLGRDLGSALRPQASEEQLVRWTRWALVGLTVVMVLFALLRAEAAAWWNVMAWTLRNGATFAPVMAAFFWPLAGRRAAIAALLGGFTAGLSWYTLSGFDPAHFFLGIHPVWVGMVANIGLLVAVTLVTRRWRVTSDARARHCAVGALAGAAVLVLAAVPLWPWLTRQGLVGLAVFLAVTSVAAAAVLAVQAAEPRESGGTTEAEQAAAVV